MLPAAGLRLVVAEERGPAQKKGGGSCWLGCGRWSWAPRTVTSRRSAFVVFEREDVPRDGAGREGYLPEGNGIRKTWSLVSRRYICT